MHNEEEVLDAVCFSPLTSTHLVAYEQASVRAVRHRVFEEQLYPSYVQFIQGQQQGDSNLHFTASSVDGFYRKLLMNLNFCAVYHGLISQHSQGVE